MTDTQMRTLVFKNAAGDYFLLPQETLERGRVPAAHKAEAERLLGEAQGAIPPATWLSTLRRSPAVSTPPGMPALYRSAF